MGSPNFGVFVPKDTDRTLNLPLSIGVESTEIVFLFTQDSDLDFRTRSCRGPIQLSHRVVIEVPKSEKVERWL